MISFSSDAACTSVTLLLFGDDLDPETISAALGIPADKSYKKGDTFSQGRSIRKRGMWSMDIKVEAETISETLNELIDNWPPDLLPVSKIESVESGRLVMWFDTSNKGDVFEITIDEYDVLQFATLGVQLCMTVFPKIDDD